MILRDQMMHQIALDSNLHQEVAITNVQSPLSKKDKEKKDMLAIGQSLQFNSPLLITNPLTFSKICTLGITALKSLQTTETPTLVKGTIGYLSLIGIGFLALNNSASTGAVTCTAAKTDMQFNMCPALIEHPWSTRQCIFLEAPPKDTLEEKIEKILQNGRKEREIEKREKEALEETWRKTREKTKKEVEILRKEHEKETNEMIASWDEILERWTKAAQPISQERREQINKEAEEEGARAFERLFQEIFGKRVPILQKPANCPTIDPNAYKNLSDFDRALDVDNKLNPLCPEHAKIILTQHGKAFDESLFKKDGCAYIKPIFRSMRLLTHPDKNFDRKKLAEKAFEAVTIAQEVLCNP